MRYRIHSEAIGRVLLPQTPDVAAQFGGRVKDIELPQQGDPDLELSREDMVRCTNDGIFRAQERAGIYTVTEIPDE